jgi:DNA-binding NtrC family response regulator
MGDVYTHVQKVADSRATVLIRGDSGTGKELVARAIHYSGNRSERPFIKVNCAALSAGLLESELFGHEKGAFTGAHDRKIGRFELADTGTLLLDEVSEMNLDLQPKLLRALQDLFFRLNVIPIQIPPLRERKEDIPAMAELFRQRYATENGRPMKPLSSSVLAALAEYDWPGNVRELQNAIERAVVLASSSILSIDDFSFPGIGKRQNEENSNGLQAGKTVAQMEKELVLKTLEHCGDNRTRASEMLGISVRTMRNKLKEYGQ